MFDEKDGRELHNIIRKLRTENGYTQEYVADYLEIDKSTYAHYEAARRTPDIKKLRKLAELYGLKDELLGARLPIIAQTVYPKKMLDDLEAAIDDCAGHTGNYKLDKAELEKLRNALEPVLDIRDAAFDLPNISLDRMVVGETIKEVRLNMRAESLISKCLRKQSEVMGWK